MGSIKLDENRTTFKVDRDSCKEAEYSDDYAGKEQSHCSD